MPNNKLVFDKIGQVMFYGFTTNRLSTFVLQQYLLLLNNVV